jgi:hypothetical protein
MNLLPIAGYFVAGTIREILCIFYYRAVTRKRDYAASGLAGGIEFYDLLILATIIRGGWSIPLMIAYTAGVMAGTFWATRHSR